MGGLGWSGHQLCVWMEVTRLALPCRLAHSDYHHHQHRHHQHQRHQHRRHQHTWSDDTEGLLPSPPLECEATPKAALGVFFILYIYFHIFTLYFRGVVTKQLPLYLYFYIFTLYFSYFYFFGQCFEFEIPYKKATILFLKQYKDNHWTLWFWKTYKKNVTARKWGFFYIHLRINRLLNKI